AYARRLPARRLDRLLGRTAPLAGVAHTALHRVELLAPLLERRLQLVATSGGGALLGAKPVQFRLDARRALGLDLRQRGLELGETAGRAGRRVALCVRTVR